MDLNSSDPPISSNVNEEEIDVENELKDEKKFRCQAKQIFLTYAQCGDWVPKLDLREIAESAILGNLKAKAWIICRERHNDGGWHIHFLFKLASKPDIRNPRFFDLPEFLGGIHPNWKIAKKASGDWWMSKAEYCMKDGDFVEENIELFPNSKGFTRKMADHKSWVEYRRQRSLLSEPKWPMLMPDGSMWNEGATGSWVFPPSSPSLGPPEGVSFPPKRVNWVIIGPPNVGKTTWVENTFANVKVFKPSEGELAFDDYAGERFIIYDDIIPPMEALLNICNVYRTRTPCWGKQRYCKKYWPINQIRVVIILANPKRWARAKLEAEEGFWERFNSCVYNPAEDRFYSLID